MFTVWMQVLGCLIFLVGTILLGAWLRWKPSKRCTERTCRVLHLLFWLWVAPPVVWGIFDPGLAHFDSVLDFSPLAHSTILMVLGSLGLLIGTCLIFITYMSLWLFGKGANALLLTRKLVVTSIYKWTRNPMSLGLYLSSVGIGLLVGSTYLTLGVLLVMIPAHIFYLKYFEEYELELRISQSYVEYKRRVPFLLPRTV